MYGGAILSVSADYFVERLKMVSWIWERVVLKPVSPPPCWFSWIVLATWPSLVLTGLIVQCAVTGRGMHHADCKLFCTLYFFLFVFLVIKQCR